MEIVDKKLTEEDVKLLNSEKGSVVVLKNTVGQDPKIIAKLSEGVNVQILAGYDYEKKEKYRSNRFNERRSYSPKQVCEIIKKFEEYEKGVDPAWSDLEKAVYLYSRFAHEIAYKDANTPDVRNLNTVLGEGVCAGIACVFKEAMDRQGIECEMLNKPRVHTWNAIKIDGVWYPIDLTWDISNVQTRGEKNLLWFGQVNDFNKYSSHEAMGENISVENNCFDPVVIMETIEKVTGEKGLTPATKNNIEDYYKKILKTISKSGDVDQIRNKLRILFDHGEVMSKYYSSEAMVSTYDKKFAGIFSAVKNNENLTDQQKTEALRATNAFWEDLLPRSVYGTMKQKSEYEVRAILNLIATQLNLPKKDFVDGQLEEWYKSCQTNGITDYEKLEEQKAQMEAQCKELLSESERGQAVVDEAHF